MKTTQIHRDRIGKVTVSTVFVEPFGYYETAVLRPGQPADVVESNVADAHYASQLHRSTVAAISA